MPAPGAVAGLAPALNARQLRAGDARVHGLLIVPVNVNVAGYAGIGAHVESVGDCGQRRVLQRVVQQLPAPDQRKHAERQDCRYRSFFYLHVRQKVFIVMFSNVKPRASTYIPPQAFSADADTVRRAGHGSQSSAFAENGHAR